MKRTNVIIDEKLLKEAKSLLGLDTNSETVNKALAEAIRIVRLQEFASLFGTGAWEGDLEEMRGDVTKVKLRPRKKRA